MSRSPRAQEAHQFVSALQRYFVQGLEQIEGAEPFVNISWLRDEGRYGGGSRFSSADSKAFNRASVNVSQVHYDDDPTKKLGSATALSTIIHPQNPHAPSMHMHISWTEMKGEVGGAGYWRMMADLNPAIPRQEDILEFTRCLQDAVPELYKEASAQGDRYFYIPALERHRGVAHFYLENYSSGDCSADATLAQRLGESVIDTYLSLLAAAVKREPAPGALARAEQLAYHTLYFFQVLTLDRGTTSGLLVHDQNDLGIMGSLPSHVDKRLLASWRNKVPELQRELLDGLLKVLPDEALEGSLVDERVKRKVAQVVRKHYQQHPEALQYQASGNVIPPTVSNHRSD